MNNRLFASAINQATGTSNMRIDSMNNNLNNRNNRNIPDGSIINNGTGFYYYSGQNIINMNVGNLPANKYYLNSNNTNFQLYSNKNSSRVFFKIRRQIFYLFMNEQGTEILALSASQAEEMPLRNPRIVPKPERMNVAILPRRNYEVYEEPPTLDSLYLDPGDSLLSGLKRTRISEPRMPRRTADYLNRMELENMRAMEFDRLDQEEEEREQREQLDSLKRRRFNEFGKNILNIKQLNKMEKYLKKMN